MKDQISETEKKRRRERATKVAMALRCSAIGKTVELKRSQLLAVAERMSKRRKYLLIFSGLLALTASSAFAGLADTFLSPATVKVVGGLLSLASGFISLLASVSMKEMEIAQIYDNATHYLRLREQARTLSIDEVLSFQQYQRRVDELQTEYVELDAATNKWLYGYLFSALENGDDGKSQTHNSGLLSRLFRSLFDDKIEVRPGSQRSDWRRLDSIGTIDSLSDTTSNELSGDSPDLETSDEGDLLTQRVDAIQTEKVASPQKQ